MLLYLIRHGETAWNRQKRYLSRTDKGLTPLGIRQGKSLRFKLKRARIDRIYSSPSRRAYKFAGQVFPGRRIIKTENLRELGFGVFEGMTYGQLMDSCPEIYSQWLKNPLKIKIPKGEPFKSFRNRVLRTLKRIIRKNKENTVAIVTHGGPIRIILGVISQSWVLHGFMPGLAKVNIIKFTKGKASRILLNGKLIKQHG